MKSRLVSLLYYGILYLLSILWNGVHFIWRWGYRYKLFKQKTFQVPIISVGNLTFGGTGKTPFIIWLSEFLQESNKKVMVSMRGYLGKNEHSCGFLKGGRRMKANPVDYGDEALLLSKRLDHVSIVVGKNRSKNLEYYFDRELPDVVLLDDGHQHLKMERNLNIVLFDALMPLEKYKVAPLGYLRENFSALHDADIIIINKAGQVSLEKLERLEELINKHCSPDVIHAQIAYYPMGIYSVKQETKSKISDFKEKNVICVTGIASTSGFYNMIESLGVKIIKKYSFPDHYFFKSHEIEVLLKEAEERDSYIIMTEKDIVKMHRFFHDRIYYLKIGVEFLKGEKEVREVVSRIV